MQAEQLKTAHRGVVENPPSRFEKITLDPDADWNPEDDVLPRTQFFKDLSQSVISRNESPDIGFRASLNLWNFSLITRPLCSAGSTCAPTLSSTRFRFV